MAKNRLLASAALTVGLLGGAAAGVVLGVPAVSGAQTTTVPDSPSTTVPGGAQTPDRAPDAGKNCPDKAGVAPAGSPANAGFRQGPGRSV